jgi:MOSC domain-containing protein YiiM
VAVLTAVCVMHDLLPEPGNPDGVTAIDKRPVVGPVHIDELGLVGDQQRDRAHHGGAEFAVYLYADEDAAFWADRLGRAIPPGLFGENLRSAGLDVSGLVIGTRLRLGEVVELEVTSPRNPCQTFARRMGEPRWVRRFTEERRPGAYLRVVTPGSVTAGDSIAVVSVPAHGARVSDLMAPAVPQAARALVAAAAAGELALGPRMLAGATRAAVGGDSPPDA